jgi:hypothetical protein
MMFKNKVLSKTHEPVREDAKKWLVKVTLHSILSGWHRHDGYEGHDVECMELLEIHTKFLLGNLRQCYLEEWPDWECNITMALLQNNCKDVEYIPLTQDGVWCHCFCGHNDTHSGSSEERNFLIKWTNMNILIKILYHGICY